MEPKHMHISFTRLFKGISLLALSMVALSALAYQSIPSKTLALQARRPSSRQQ